MFFFSTFNIQTDVESEHDNIKYQFKVKIDFIFPIEFSSDIEGKSSHY